MGLNEQKNKTGFASYYEVFRGLARSVMYDWKKFHPRAPRQPINGTAAEPSGASSALTMGDGTRSG
ncbi:MAG TPA: hypothetical protein DEF59_02290 [Candidatus Magasanikbacteria bacterium]|nr:hypothetical protein [Candidatus Magasanikbacteria bacterium]